MELSVSFYLGHCEPADQTEYRNRTVGRRAIIFFKKAIFPHSLLLKSFGSLRGFFFKIIQQKHIKLTKSDSKDIYKCFQKYIYFK